jgi:hypothetical protein
MQFGGPASQRTSISAPVSSMVISGRAKGSVLKDKVGDLMGSADDIDVDDDLLEELRDAAKEKAAGKKGLFGLFGKK